jgi:hypothetical protein
MPFTLPEDLAYYLTPHDQQLLATTVDQLAPSLHEPLLQCTKAAAQANSRLLSTTLPLMGPILHALPEPSRIVLLKRIAALSQTFPAVVMPLFRSLDRVFEEVGEERALALGKRSRVVGQMRERPSSLSSRAPAC